MKKRSCIVAISFLVILGMIDASLEAADYPVRAITVINPWPPGGLFDAQGRAFTSVAEKYLGKPMVVLNKPGGSGMIGIQAIVQAAPDGYSLGVVGSYVGYVIEGEIANGRKPPFSWDDLIPIGSFTLSPTLVVVPYDSPWKTLADLIKDCKAKPDHYAFSSGGKYSGSHLPAEIFMRATGIKARHVPFTGGGPALTALVGGHVDFATQFVPAVLPLAQGNKLRILASQSNRRLKSIPDVPTVRELGIDAENQSWVGIAVPQKTPADIVEKLREVFKKVTEDKSFVNIIETQGDEVYYMKSDDVARYWENESEKLAKLYKQLVQEKQ